MPVARARASCQRVATLSSPDRLRACLPAGMLVGVRIAATSVMLIGGSSYRVFSPLQAMERRGHEIVWPDMGTGLISRDELLSSDVVLVFRCRDRATRRL